jgi:ACS family D-galactonate transporter-like MFS transporter
MALILMRVIVGAAEAIVMPASYRWIRNNFHEGQSGTAVGIFTMGNKFGPAIGAPVAAWLIVNYDWRLMFILTGAVGLIWLMPWVLLVKNDLPRGAVAKAEARKAARIGHLLEHPCQPGRLGGDDRQLLLRLLHLLLHDLDAGLSGRAARAEPRAIGPLYLLQLCRHRDRRGGGGLGGGPADRARRRPGVRPQGLRHRRVHRRLHRAARRPGPLTELALFWNVFSLSFLGLATANNLALCRLTLIPKPAIGLVTGVQQVATSLAGGVAASLSGWLLHTSGSYELPMLVIFVFLLIGALACWILLRPQWAPRVTEIVE